MKNGFKVLLLLIMVGLIACSETKSASTPRILGVPPQTSYVDVSYEYTFGADGGDNILQYRFVQAPPWLNIESLNGAKPEFRIYGVPTLAPGDDFDKFEGADFEVIIEVSDGSRSSQETYDLALLTNYMFINGNKFDIEESVTSSPIDDNAPDLTCPIPDLTPYENEGRTVYPFAIEVFLQFLPESRVEIPYTLSSSYFEGLPGEERGDKNILNARPQVDYVDEGGSVVFEAGELRCYAVFGIYDDALIEADEVFNVKFDKVIDGFVKLKSSLLANTIIDNEPDVTWDSDSRVHSEGAVSTYTLTLTEAVSFPITINVFADSRLTTAEPDDYTIDPSTVTFDANTLTSTFIVTIENDADTGDSGSSEVVNIRNEVSAIFDLSPIVTTINDWTSNVVVADSGLAEVANSLSVNAIDNVIVLTTESGADDDAVLSIYLRNGTETNFTANAAESIIASVDSKEEVGTAVEAVKWSSRHDVVVTATTTGKVVETNAGHRDVVIRRYSGNGVNNLHAIGWTKQLGSTGDDISTGATIDPSGNVYVYGSTTGTLDNDEINKGGADAFFAKYNNLGDLQWVRMVGTAGEDVAKDIEFSKSRVHLIGSTTGSLDGVNQGGEDGFIVTFDPSGALIRQAQFGTIHSDTVSTSVGVDGQIVVSGHSLGDFTGTDGRGDYNPEASRESVDIFALNFDEQLRLDSTLMYGDVLLGDEQAASTVIGDLVILAGSTLGVIDEEVSLGLQDAFLSGIEVIENLSNQQWVNQFGTDKDDMAIDVSSNGDKVMVLWQTIDGATSYKVTPFDGTTGSNLVIP